MSISGVGQSYYQNNVATTRNVNNTEKFALEKTESTLELSEAEEMAILKKEFMLKLIKYQRIEQKQMWQSTYQRKRLKI